MAQNINTICNEIRKYIHDAVYEMIECGWPGIEHEFKYGTAYIVVTMRESGYVRVDILHEDDRHSSPRIEAAILACLPEWSEIEDKYREDMRNSTYVDDWALFCEDPRHYY